MGGLQHTSTQAEDALSQGIGKLQQNLAETLTAAADPFEIPDGAVGRRWSGRSGGLVGGGAGVGGDGAETKTKWCRRLRRRSGVAPAASEPPAGGVDRGEIFF